MRRVLVVLLAVVASGAMAVPAAAEPALLIFRTQDGALHSSRVADLDDVLRTCGVEAPDGSVPFLPLVLQSEERRQVLIAHFAAADEALYLRAGPGPFLERGTWCAATLEVAQALQRSQRLPANRGPWLAFIGSIGFLVIMIGLVAAWGGGIGPLPTLAREGTADDEEAEH